MLWLFACTTARISWEVTPPPEVTVDTTRIAIAAEERECRAVADALIDSLGARPGVRIDPAASTWLLVTECEVSSHPVVEVQHQGGAVDAWSAEFEEQRRVVVEGQGSATIVIYSNGVELTSLPVESQASESSPWSEESVPSARLYAVDQQVVAGLADEVADSLVPLPVGLERRIYKDPEPGTARSLHNQAVAAEASGDLHGALDLAREAYAANPNPHGARYIDELEARMGAAYAQSTD